MSPAMLITTLIQKLYGTNLIFISASSLPSFIAVNAPPSTGVISVLVPFTSARQFLLYSIGRNTYLPCGSSTFSESL